MFKESDDYLLVWLEFGCQCYNELSHFDAVSVKIRFNLGQLEGYERLFLKFFCSNKLNVRTLSSERNNNIASIVVVVEERYSTEVRVELRVSLQRTMLLVNVQFEVLNFFFSL